MSLIKRIKESLEKESWKMLFFCGTIPTVVAEPFAWNPDKSFDSGFYVILPLLFLTGATIGHAANKYIERYHFKREQGPTKDRGYVTMRQVGQRVREGFFPLAEEFRGSSQS